jgi:hypothetical protein
VKKLDFADPPSLSFASTAVGSTSSDSPQTITMTNIGNAALTFPVPTTGLNPSIAVGFAIGNSSHLPAACVEFERGDACARIFVHQPDQLYANYGRLHQRLAGGNR